MSDVAAFGIMFVLGAGLMTTVIIGRPVQTAFKELRQLLKQQNPQVVEDVPPIGDPVSRGGFFMGI